MTALHRYVSCELAELVAPSAPGPHWQAGEAWERLYLWAYGEAYDPCVYTHDAGAAGGGALEDADLADVARWEVLELLGPRTALKVAAVLAEDAAAPAEVVEALRLAWERSEWGGGSWED